MREFLSDLWDFAQAWAVLLTLPAWLPVLVVAVGLFPATFMRVTEGKGWADMWQGLADVWHEAKAGRVLASLGVLGLYGLAMAGVTLLGYGTGWGLVLMAGLSLSLGSNLVRVWLK